MNQVDSGDRHSGSPRDRRRAGPGVWLTSLCLFAAAGLSVLERVPWLLQGKDLFSDDAYYYIVTARNFVETGRCSFDGLAETNGFHPLLFWLEAAGFAVFGTQASPWAQYVAVCCALGAVFLLTVAFALAAACAGPWSESEAVVRPSLLLAFCVLLLPPFTAPFLNGMESILVLALVVLLGGLVWKAHYRLAGLAALLLVMARLDTLPYLVGPLGVACLWRERRRGRPGLRAGIWTVAPAVLGTLAYMGWNWRHFGHPLPIHGVLKSCFPLIHFQPGQLLGGDSGSIIPIWVLLATAAGAALLLAGSNAQRGNAQREARGAGLVAAGLGLTQLAAFVLFQKWSKPLPAWYYGPAVPAASFALAVGLGNTLGPRRLRRLTAVLALVVLGVNVGCTARAWHHWWRRRADPSRPVRLSREGPVQTIDFMREQPAGLIWACTDCGKLAFWSGRRVVNLDGLVNDFGYQDALRRQGLARYLLQRQVDYLVFLAWDRPQTADRPYEPMYECRVAPGLFSGEYEAVDFYVISYQHMVYSDKLRLPRAAEVWRSTAAWDGKAMGRAVVFDLKVARTAHE